MVGVGSEFGLGLGFTADDRRLGLYSGHQVMVRVRVSSSRQGALRLHRRLCAYTRNRERMSIVHIYEGFNPSEMLTYY